MHIVTLRVNGLKSLSTFEFSPNRHLNVFTGANNTGKSAVLQSLRVLQTLLGHPWPFKEAVRDITTDRREDPPAISISVRILEDDWRLLGARVAPADDFLFNFKMTSDSRIEPTLVAEVGPSTSRPAILWDNEMSMFEEGDFDPQKELARSMSDPSRKTGLDPLRLFLQSLFCYDPFRTLSSSNDLSDFRPFDSSGSKLTRHLVRWKLNGDDRWDQYCHLIEGVFPGLGQLVTPQVEGTNEAYLAFRRRTTMVRASETGTGVQQLLILAYQCVAKDAHVLALEEPEAHLHPAAQRLLAEKLRSLAQVSQVFVVTHSPLFVDRNEYHNNWLVSLDENGRTLVSALKSPDPLRAVRNALGVAVGDALFAGDAVVVVEGPTEQFVLPMLSELARQVTKPSIDFNRVALVCAGGIGNIEDVVKVLTGFNVPIALVVDDDHNSRQVVNRCVRLGLVNEKAVYIVKRSKEDDGDAEFEDVLRLDLYLGALNSLYETSLSVDTFRAKEAELAADRHGKLPPRTHVCRALLVELGKLDVKQDYNKVGVAITATEKHSPSDIPPAFLEISSMVANLLKGSK